MDITTIENVIKVTKLTKSAKFSIIHALKYKKTPEGQDPNSKNYLKLIISFKFEHSSMPTRSQSKIKTIGNANICDTFIISGNSIIGHSLAGPRRTKTGPKQLQMLKIEHLS